MPWGRRGNVGLYDGAQEPAQPLGATGGQRSRRWCLETSPGLLAPIDQATPEQIGEPIGSGPWGQPV